MLSADNGFKGFYARIFCRILDGDLPVMTKIRNKPPEINDLYRIRQDNFKNDAPDGNEVVLVDTHGLSLEELQSIYDGYDYGSWKKGKVRGKHGNHGRKEGHKKKLEAEIQKILEEQKARQEAQAKIEQEQALKQEQIKQEQIRDDQQKQDFKAQEIRTEQRKDDLKREDRQAEESKRTAPKEVKKSYSDSVENQFQVEIPRNEHLTPSFTSILQEQQIDTEVKQENQSG